MKGGRIFRRWFRPLLLIMATGLFVSLYQSWIRIPANFAPWGLVELEQPPGWLARVQINSLASDPAACIAALDRSALKYRRTPARPIVEGCGLEAAVRPLRSHVAYNRPFDVTCGMMAALYSRRSLPLLQHRAQPGLQPAARQPLPPRSRRLPDVPVSRSGNRAQCAGIYFSLPQAGGGSG
jgi:hypothetical protein